MNVTIGGIEVGESGNPLLIAGPCVLDGYDEAALIADHASRAAEKHGFDYVFKASYTKDNRTSVHSYRGPGIEKGLMVLARLRETTGCPVLSDVHSAEEAVRASEVLDVIQIPAFLCRQTSLILAAASTGRVINLKKGQFVAPEQILHAVEKAKSVPEFAGAILVERGSTFGYGDLVVDFRGFDVMRSSGYPVIFDVTHSLQIPGGHKDHSGGRPQFVPTMARAGIAAGISGLFLEVHPDPASSKSDSGSIYPLERLDSLLEGCRIIWDARLRIKDETRSLTEGAGRSLK